MKKLESEQYLRARDFLYSQARPLEKAIFNLEFEGGTFEGVLTELRNFQNPDGGFGLALEPDVRTPISSALCTEIGLRYLAERGIPADHPMVAAAVKYLLESIDPKTLTWRVLPPAANDHPHAPWWHDKDGSLARTFDDFLVIPRAGILAILYHYTELVSTEWLFRISEQVVSDIENLETKQFSGDTLVYALRLVNAPGLVTPLKSRLLSRLREIADAIVTRDPQAWASYSTPPLKLAPTPSSPVSDLFTAEIQIQLDYLLTHQTADGFWEPTWSWGESYPEDWEKAKDEWRGILTIDHLISLRAFGRI